MRLVDAGSFLLFSHCRYRLCVGGAGQFSALSVLLLLRAVRGSFSRGLFTGAVTLR